MEIAKVIDSTILRPDTSPSDIDRLCQEAREYGFFGLCVPPYYIPRARKALQGSQVKVISVAGFPLGFGPSRAKLTEVRKLLEAGVQEIDMVINIAALKSGDDTQVLREMTWAVRQSRKARFKMIIETCYLTQEEKVRACELVLKSGAHFVKTSTGLGPSGATVEDVRLLASVAHGKIGVKAAGGIRDLRTLLAMIEAGASRIGTSSAAAIMKEANEAQASHYHRP